MHLEEFSFFVKVVSDPEAGVFNTQVTPEAAQHRVHDADHVCDVHSARHVRDNRACLVLVFGMHDEHRDVFW